MKRKMVILFVLIAALFVSASVSTLSEFSTTTSFSVGITVDKEKIKGNNGQSVNAEPAGLNTEVTGNFAADQLQSAIPDVTIQ